MTHENTMQAAVWEAPRVIMMREQPVPVPGPGEVLLRVDAVGICGSELGGFLGHNSLRVPPLVMGHEFAGTVLMCGAGATMPEGTRVAVNPLITCGECRYCKAGRPVVCERRRLIGVHRPGAFAGFVAVPAGQCVVMPDGLSAVNGALAEPFACGIHAIGLAEPVAGARLLVIGAGAIGLMCIAAARMRGVGEIYCTDRAADRLVTAAQWGAQPMSAMTLAPDVVVDAVGAAATRRLAAQQVASGGRVVLIGLHEDATEFTVNTLIRNEISLLGSYSYTHAEFSGAVAILAQGGLASDPSWVERRPLVRCAESFAQLVDAPPAVAKIMLIP